MVRRILLWMAVVFLPACTSVFLQPDKVARTTPDRLGIKYEDVWITAGDGVRTHAWYLHSVGQRRQGTVLFLHGNAQNISAHIASVKWLPARGFDVLMIDPRGYGQSEGSADIDGVHRDARAALQYLSERVCGEIIVFGQSLGGAMAIYTVAQSKKPECVRGVVTEGAFSTYRGIAKEKLNVFWVTWAFQKPLSLLFSDEYSPLARVAAISPIPLLIIHGENDPIVPLAHARKLYGAAGSPRQLWVIPKGGHITALIDAKRRDRVVLWMKEAIGVSRKSVVNFPTGTLK